MFIVLNFCSHSVLNIYSGSLFIQCCARFLLVKCQLTASSQRHQDKARREKGNYCFLVSRYRAKSLSWSASGILLYRSQATQWMIHWIFNDLFWDGYNHLALFTHLTFYLLDLRSALPTLDRIVKGFRKLGAIRKTRDVLYFQVICLLCTIYDRLKRICQARFSENHFPYHYLNFIHFLKSFVSRFGLAM